MTIDNKDNIADENSVEQESFADEEDDFLDESDPEDALLLEALRTYDDEMLDKFFSENDDEKPVPLSCEGREKMEELLGQWLGPQKAQQVLKKEEKQYQQELRRWKQQRRRQMFSRVPRWCFAAAAALLAVIIGVANPKSSLAFKLPEVGFEAVVGSERTRLHSFMEVINGNENPNLEIIENEYVLGKVIDGYQLEDQVSLNGLKTYIYANIDLNKYYVFSQQTESFDIGVNTESESGKYIDTLYGKAYYFSDQGINSIIWNYNEYYFKIEGTLSLDELIDLLSSLKEY